MSWILTHSGQKFDLLSPQPEQVNIHDIAHALSHLCRFNGHTSEFYSVAHHSLLVASIVHQRAPEHTLIALLHDAHEAYTGDITRPLKIALNEITEGLISEIEGNVHQAICAHFGIDPAIPDVVHEADMIALATERKHLMHKDHGYWECLEGVEPHPSADLDETVAHKCIKTSFLICFELAKAVSA